MKSRLADVLIPVPMAAPETRALRRARLSLIVAAVALAISLLFFTTILALFGRGVALALPVGLLVFAAIQGPVWLRAKNKADDYFLLNGKVGR
jgi:hypothetical protein